MNTLQNRRVLLVDDLPSIHEDFRKILAKEAASPALDADEAILFGGTARASSVCFQMDSAFQGAEAIEKLQASLRSGTPYAMAFVDMRMPPGLDGVETVEGLWKADPELQVVLCTAYSDYSWMEVLARLDTQDRLLILKKPFDPVEVYQFANALTAKWKLSKQAAFKMNELEAAVEARTRELSDANIIVRSSPVILYRLRGEPALPLIYVSHNITKFGHDPAVLLASPDWAEGLIHADDRQKVGDAMARVLEKDAQGASIEFRLCAGDGSLHWVENRYVPVRDREGRIVEIEGIVIDITERKAAEEKIAQLARTDGLTGLANRTVFMERLAQAFASARRGALPFAALYLDLDKFKPVNDTLGHPVGDRLLQEVATRLRACTRQSDLVARLGGDEFAILQGEVKEAANAGELAAKIQAALCEPYSLDGNDVRISVSIGICPYDASIPSAEAMLAQADRALYRSKEEGRNRYRFHSEDLDAEVLDRVNLAAELRKAIDGEELELLYQPQVELSSRVIVGMEALVRWNHPVRGCLQPSLFVPLAERTGAIIPLGRWVLEQACRQMRAWRDAGLRIPLVAVNLSLLQLQRGGEFVREVTSILSKWKLSPGDLEFDVTEGTLAQLKWTRNEVLPQLRDLGVKIAIDNFGSEYSSFDYVRAYGINHLKIAQSFVTRACSDPASAATINAIIGFARDVGIGVIAQGVETDEQRSLLSTADSSAQAQGFHFSKAVSAEEAAEMLRRGRIVHPQQAPATSAEDVASTAA